MINIYIMMGTVDNYLTDSLTPLEYDQQFSLRMGWTDLLPEPSVYKNKYKEQQ